MDDRERGDMNEGSDFNMNADHDNDLLRLLAAADPVDPSTIPSASEQTPQQLLEHIMTEETTGSADYGHRPNQATAMAADAQRAASNRRASLASRGMLVSAAAAVLILLGGILVFSPDNTQSALATVHSAAATTADADTGRITSTFSMEEQGEGAEGIAGTLEAAYAGADVAVTVDAAGFGDDDQAERIPIDEFRLIGDTLYVNTEDGWIALDTNGLLGDLVADYIDPRAVLERVEELTETTEIGSADIDGVSTTHFQSVVDLGDETLSESGWAGHEGLPVEADGEVTVDLYVGDDDLLRRLELSGEVVDDGEGDSGTFSLVMDFVDLGSDVTIEAPADAEAFDPFADGFDGLEEELDA